MPRAIVVLQWIVAAGVAAQLHPATSFLILPIAALAGLVQGSTQPMRYERRLDRLEWAVAIWLLGWLVSTLLALEVGHALALSIPVLVFALLFVVLHRADDARLHDALLLALIALATAQSVALLFAATTAGTPPQWTTEARSPWLLVPNDAVWMLCLWPLWWLRAGTLARRGLCAALLVPQLAALILLQSRLALLMLIALALCATHGWLQRRDALSMPSAPRRRGTIVIVALVLLVAVGIAVALWSGKGGGSLHARGQLAQAAWQMWLAHPWFGVGPHGFGFEYLQYVDGPLVDPRYTPWPHSLPLELLACTGVIGFAAILRVIQLAVSRCIETGAAHGVASRAWAASMLMFGIASLLEASTLRLWWWVVLVVLLGCAMPKAREQHS